MFTFIRIPIIILCIIYDHFTFTFIIMSISNVLLCMYILMFILVFIYYSYFYSHYYFIPTFMSSLFSLLSPLSFYWYIFICKFTFYVYSILLYVYFCVSF